MTDSGGRKSAVQPGPVYDTSLRRLIERDLSALCRLIGVPVGKAPPQLLSAKLPVSTLEADLLVRVAPGHLVHLEYARTGTADLVARMAIYRGLILRQYPKDRLGQFVLVLGDGHVRGHPDLREFERTLTTIYLRELEPARFLTSPPHTSLAVLGRGDRGERAKVFAESLRLIKARGGPHMAERYEFAITLAPIRLDRTIIDAMIEEEENMSMSLSLESSFEFYYGIKYFRQLVDNKVAEGVEQGVAEGLEQARAELLEKVRAEALVQARAEALVQARAEALLQERAVDQARAVAQRAAREEMQREILVTLLRDRFGDHPDLAAVAQELISWQDTQSAVHAVTSATTLADVLATGAPQPS